MWLNEVTQQRPKLRTYAYRIQFHMGFSMQIITDDKISNKIYKQIPRNLIIHVKIKPDKKITIIAYK